MAPRPIYQQHLATVIRDYDRRVDDELLLLLCGGQLHVRQNSAAAVSRKAAEPIGISLINDVMNELRDAEVFPRVFFQEWAWLGQLNPRTVHADNINQLARELLRRRFRDDLDSHIRQRVEQIRESLAALPT